MELWGDKPQESGSAAGGSVALSGSMQRADAACTAAALI